MNKHDNFSREFKDYICKKLLTLISETDNYDIKQSLEQTIGDIHDYDTTIYNSSDFEKKKRVRNIIKPEDRCKANRANGQQCTRRHKNGSNYCGTHIKGLPHGHIDLVNNAKKKQIKVWTEEINGIHYYIDNNNNVYDTYDIIENKPNPRIIKKYTTIFNKTKNTTSFILNDC